MSSVALDFSTVEEIEAHLEAMEHIPCEGPTLSDLDHALQCAAELKLAAPDDVELQIAGLVHDIAHSKCHIRDHGNVGSAAVRRVLGERVAALVQRHIAAKRYLVSTSPEYLARLSETSVKTFELQGGLMTSQEIEDFAVDPYRDDAIKIREADDAAKIPGRAVPGLDAWRASLRLVAERA